MSTEKKIVDYLHLYGLDCPIMTPDGEGRVLVIYPKVVEVSLQIIKHQQVMKGRKGGGEMHYKYNYEDCQLLLYRLEDMQEKDLLEVIGFNKFPDREIIRFEKEETLIAVYYRWPAENLNDDGYGYSSSALYFDKEEWTPEQFQYLLSKGYWLFGNDWFDEGLIIDKKTLK